MGPQPRCRVRRADSSRTFPTHPPPRTRAEQIVGTLPTLPHHPLLMYTATLTLAAYADWFAASLKAQVASCVQLFPQLLAMLGRALQDPEAASAGALAFKHVCDACRSLLQPYWADLQTMYSSVVAFTPQQAGGAPVAPGALRMTPMDVLQVIEGMSCVISSFPLDQLDSAIQVLTAPIATALQATLATQQATVPGILSHVDKLSAIFKSVNRPPVVARLLMQVWNILDTALSAVGPSDKGAERVTRAMRLGLKTAGVETAPMLQHLFSTIPARYKEHHHACILYLSSELVKIYGADPQLQGALRQIVHDLVAESAPFLQQPKDFDEKPDVADDFFLLSCRVLSYCPSIFLLAQPPVGGLVLHLLTLAPDADGIRPRAQVLPHILHMAITGLYVQHPEASQSILQCLQRICDLDGPHYQQVGAAGVQAATAAVGACGPQLVHRLLGALLGVLPMSRMGEVGTTLYLLCRSAGEQGLQWVQQSCAAVPETAASHEDKQPFLFQALQASQRHKGERYFVAAASELGELCRRNRKAGQAIVQVFVEGAPGRAEA